jgi:hypothetical protein
VRNELMAFVATQEERENQQRGEAQRIWDENIRELMVVQDSKSRESEQQEPSATSHPHHRPGAAWHAWPRISSSSSKITPIPP